MTRAGAPRDGQLTIRTIRSLEEIPSIRAAWEALQTSPWADVDHYVEHLASQEGFVRPHVLVLEDGERPVAVIAGSLVRETLPWRIGSLTFLRSRARLLRIGGGTVMGEVSAPAAELVTRTLLEALRAGEADAVYLHQVASDAPLVRSVEGVTGLARDRWARTSAGWILEIPATFEEYLASRTKSVRRHMKRYANVLERRLGEDLSITCYRDPGDLERLVADSERVARLTYHRGMHVGFEDTPTLRAFFARALRVGWMRGYVMYAKERPIAFWHGLVYRGTFVSRDTGFDPEFGDLRPGQYLVTRLIEDLCRTQEATRVDYGIMELDYKRNFGTSRYERSSLYLFSRSPKGLWLSTLRTTTGAGDRLARKLLGTHARHLTRKLATLGRRKAPPPPAESDEESAPNA